MNTIRPGSATERLTTLISDKDRYDVPHADLLPVQIEAANEIFQDRLVFRRSDYDSLSEGVG